MCGNKFSSATPMSMFPALIRTTASLSWSRALTSNNVSPTSYLKGSMISYLPLCASKFGICVRSFSFKHVACVLFDIFPPSCSSFDLHSCTRFESLNMCSDWFSDWCISSMKEICSANAMAGKICFDSACIRYLSLKCVRHCLWHAASIAIMSPDNSFAKIRVSRSHGAILRTVTSILKLSNLNTNIDTRTQCLWKNMLIVCKFSSEIKINMCTRRSGLLF